MLKVFPSLLFLNLSDTITDIKSNGSLELWNSFLLSLIFLNFSVFWLILISRKKQKIVYFLALLFYTETILDIFFFGIFNLVFFFFWQVFKTISWLFFYSYFVLCIILSSFFFRIFFFSFLQELLPIKPVIIHFYMLIWRLIKKMFFY